MKFKILPHENYDTICSLFATDPANVMKDATKVAGIHDHRKIGYHVSFPSVWYTVNEFQGSP